MADKLSSYDPAEDLGSEEAVATFMTEALCTGDAGYIAHALGVVARARGITQIANETGLSREQLYRSFSENGNPTLKTTLAVMKALGIRAYGEGPTRAELGVCRYCPCRNRHLLLWHATLAGPM